MRASALAMAAAMALGLARSLVAQAGSDGDALRQVERRLRDIDSGWTLEVPAGTSIADRMLLDWGGSASLGLYAIDDARSRSHMMNQYDGRIYLRAELDGAHRFFGRLKYRYEDWRPGEDFDGRGDGRRDAIAERWWYEFDLRGAMQSSRGERPASNVNVKLGKQFVQWGEGLALSTVLVSGVAECEWNGLILKALVGDTPADDTVDFDASRPGFDRDTRRRFLGAELDWPGGAFEPFIHVLRQIDRNSTGPVIYADALHTYPTQFDYDSDYLGVGARGGIGVNWLYRTELCLETGRALSSPIAADRSATAQTREDIRAWAFLGALSWPLQDKRQTRFDGTLLLGSGDDDRLDSADTFGGNLTGTSDRAFNGLGFANTGLALAPDLSNLATLHMGGVTSPFFGFGEKLDRLRTVLDGYFFLKLDPNAPINVPTTANRTVGGEIDVGFDWGILSDVTLQARYGVFIPGAAMPRGEDGTRQVIFVGVTCAF